jgi:hypothetical protein
MRRFKQPSQQGSRAQCIISTILVAFSSNKASRLSLTGRTDQLFLNGFMATLYTTLRNPDAADDFKAILDRHRITWALVPPNSHHAAKLRQAQWPLIYQDDVAEVFKRPE